MPRSETLLPSAHRYEHRRTWRARIALETRSPSQAQGATSRTLMSGPGTSIAIGLLDGLPLIGMPVEPGTSLLAPPERTLRASCGRWGVGWERPAVELTQRHWQRLLSCVMRERYRLLSPLQSVGPRPQGVSEC